MMQATTATTTIVPRMTLIFDESQSKYKCCCGCMSVRTGAALIATLKALGVIVAILELFTGPHFISYTDDQWSIKTTTTTTDPLNFELEIQPATTTTPAARNSNLDAVRFASTVIYLLIEAVAVSCLIAAIRLGRPKLVVPEMALIVVCMSLELLGALLVVVAAMFGSEQLVQMVIKKLHEQGTEVTSGDVDEIRRMLPFVLTALAFGLLMGAAVEFWFLRTLRSYYRYLRDKATFYNLGGGNDGENLHCYVNQPMLDGDETATHQGQQPKDMPPAYQEVVKQEGDSTTMAPPSYKEFVDPAQPLYPSQQQQQ